MTQQEIENPNQPKFYFTDSTILGSEGQYQVACDIMDELGAARPWVLLTGLTMVHAYGICQAKLEFYDDGVVKIIDFYPSNRNPTENVDVRQLRAWLNEKGWKSLTVSKYVMDTTIQFWLHMWKVFAIDSENLEKRFGSREDDDQVTNVRES